MKNSEGLHVSVIGDSGKGKTHAFRKMMQQVPDRYIPDKTPCSDDD